MNKKRVLKDHKQKGKKFIPPFIHMIGNLNEVSWVKNIIPEVIWTALIQDYHGLRKGVNLISSLASSTRNNVDGDIRGIYALISDYKDISTKEKELILDELRSKKDLEEIKCAIYSLILLYPECPLNFIFPKKLDGSEAENKNLKYLKKVLSVLFDKHSRDAIFVQATMIHLAFQSGRLHVKEGLSLAKLHKIENYPYTEESKSVAAAIRSSINMFFAEPFFSPKTKWPKYFWNRGLEIDHCNLEDTRNE